MFYHKENKTLSISPGITNPIWYYIKWSCFKYYEIIWFNLLVTRQNMKIWRTLDHTHCLLSKLLQSQGACSIPVYDVILINVSLLYFIFYALSSLQPNDIVIVVILCLVIIYLPVEIKTWTEYAKKVSNAIIECMCYNAINVSPSAKKKFRRRVLTIQSISKLPTSVLRSNAAPMLPEFPWQIIFYLQIQAAPMWKN